MFYFFKKKYFSWSNIRVSQGTESSPVPLLPIQRRYFKMNLFQTNLDSMLIFPKLSYGRSVFTHTHMCICVRAPLSHILSHFLSPQNILFPHLCVPMGESESLVIDQYHSLIGQCQWRFVRAQYSKNGRKQPEKKNTQKEKQQKFRHAAPEQRVG